MVEDSRVVAALLRRILEDAGMTVVGPVGEGEAAVALAADGACDVVLMDLGLPGMTGLETIEHIMELRALPIVVLSGMVRGPDQGLGFAAMEAGAVDVLAKPGSVEREAPGGFAEALVRTVRLMSEVRVVRRRRPTNPGPLASFSSLAPPEEKSPRLLAIGASTGGPQVLRQLLSAIRPPAAVPVVIAQHIYPGYDEGLVRWLTETGHGVELAQAPTPLEAGRVYVAPADADLVLAAPDRLEVRRGNPGHISPSVDRLFSTAADHLGSGVWAVLLTGMGRDGAEGMLRLRKAGALTLAQDEESSVVYGMPRVAWELGAVGRRMDPRSLARFLGDRLGGPSGP